MKFKRVSFEDPMAISLPPKPESGWVQWMRGALQMSLRQLGKRLNISAQSVNDLERREREASITLHALQQAAEAMNMKLVYALVPKEKGIEEMIRQRAEEKAKEIVMRTHQTMILEKQGAKKEWIENAIRQKTEELMLKMPRYLWD
ncbi:MAG: mobile mystery protein A [Bacteroidia bacterium]|nr:mobile mystery protein A [Bacteroidia bacterium]